MIAYVKMNCFLLWFLLTGLFSSPLSPNPRLAGSEVVQEDDEIRLWLWHVIE
ncbi:hypothetical protein MANES_12G107050v8 [Manihot esculenta]|uniref:Uncharacterized protein n=1 Tax=Manihot esculenta TaxID=3983 RepID=A0ACB7GSJ4_MANES|nr:hypothetical protein MANES_12G107050v8 [Manihot esculenta]